MVDILGDSDVPLDDKRVLEPRQREFFPTFAEWASDGNIEQVTQTFDLGTTFYTVPKNHTLFVTSVFLNGAEGGNVSGHAVVEMVLSNPPNNNDRFIFLSIRVDHTAGQHGGADSLSLSFPMPIRVEQDEIVNFLQGGFDTPLVKGAFSGFLLPKKISIR